MHFAPSCLKFLRECTESESWNIRCDGIILAQIRSIRRASKVNFWVNWLTLLCSKYWIPSYYNISKRTKRGFLGKLTNVTFDYLFSLTILNCFKKNLYDRSWEIRLNNIEANWALIVLLPEKEIFSEID